MAVESEKEEKRNNAWVHSKFDLQGSCLFTRNLKIFSKEYRAWRHPDPINATNMRYQVLRCSLYGNARCKWYVFMHHYITSSFSSSYSPYFISLSFYPLLLFSFNVVSSLILFQRGVNWRKLASGVNGGGIVQM